jgi:hypothetical protein
MIQTLEKTINGSSYSVTQLPARRALRLQAKLVKLLGPAVSTIFVASGDLDNADQSIPKAIAALASQLDDKSFDQLVLDLLQGQARKNGKEINEAVLDMEFAGNLNELFLLLAFVLEVNFGDFFREGGILSSFLNLQMKTEIEA